MIRTTLLLLCMVTAVKHGEAWAASVLPDSSAAPAIPGPASPKGAVTPRDSSGAATAATTTPPGAPTLSLGSSVGHDAGPVATAAPLVGSVKVDGHLDEPAWDSATPITGFTQRDPNEGQPCTERTVVKFLLGEDALYVGARLFDSEPSKIRARLVRRDEDLDSDYLAVLIDSYHDHVTASVFRVNPAGSINDAAIGVSGNQDLSWNPVWLAHTSIDSLGWVAEIEIPLTQLRYSSHGDGTWGIQVRRWIYRKQEFAEFAFTPKSEMSAVATYGHLAGLERLRSPRHLEVLPYSLVRSEFRRVQEDNPFRDGSDQFGAAGLDLKYGLTSNLTLNATVNPDFGEVEVDPAVVNLTAFETLFPERRPFFVEGADIFEFGLTSSFNNFNTTIPFHARRIGRPPQRVIQGDEIAFVDTPDRTTITTATKLTGKTRNGWTVGLLDAVTPEERASFADTVGVEGALAVEPWTNYFVGRLRRDYRKGNTILGGLFTSVHRDLSDPGLESLLRSRAYTGGLDLNHYWAGRRWSLDANVLVSRVEGSQEVIDLAQRSSARYYQRPDADHLDYDPTRTSLSGAAGLLSLNKAAGRHWRGSLTYQDWSPGFEINDIGFQNAADSRGFSSLLMYVENKPGPIFRDYVLFTFQNNSWNYGGDPTYAGLAAHAEGTLRNYWAGYVRGSWFPSAYDDRLTRGGPLSRVPEAGDAQVNLTTDSRKSTTLSFHGETAWDEAGGWNRYASASVAIRPASSLRITLEPGIRKRRDNAQYVTAVADPEAADTYGTRYVFATIDQTTLNLDTRVDWTLSPKLSLQFYGQPLVVTGDYFDLKELRRPRTYEFDVYGRNVGTAQPASGGTLVDPDGSGPAPAFTIGDLDFNFRSLIGNAVIRWEYRPGSAIFLVWQQTRKVVRQIGDFDLSRDVGGIFRGNPENVVALKVTYWLGL